MSKKESRKESRMVTGAKVGSFHFAPFGTQQYRLLAVLYNGATEILHVAPTVGDLWRRPWLVPAERDSDIVELRVERQVDRNGKVCWRPMIEASFVRRYDED